MAKAQIVIGANGGGGIDLANPDDIVTQNTTASTFYVATTGKPKYVIVASSRQDNGKYQLVVGDFTNETVVGYSAYSGNYEKISDSYPFSTFFNNITTSGFTCAATTTASCSNIVYIYY